MNEFLSELNSLYWWISVVVVGIVINLISAYFQKSLDSRFSKISSWWRKKSEARNALFQAQVQELRNNKDGQLFLAIEELRAWFFAIFTTLGALGVLIVGVSAKLNNPNDPTLITSVETSQTVTTILFVLIYSVAMTQVSSAAKKHELLMEARKLDSLQNKQKK